MPESGHADDCRHRAQRLPWFHCLVRPKVMGRYWQVRRNCTDHGDRAAGGAARGRGEAHADVGALSGLQASGAGSARSELNPFPRWPHASDGDGGSSGIGQRGRLSLGLAHRYVPETYAGWSQFDPASQDRGAFQREGGGQTNLVAGEYHSALRTCRRSAVNMRSGGRCAGPAPASAAVFDR